MGDVVNTINAGLTGTPASLNANSAMVLQAQTVGQGIAINERDSAVTVAGGRTRGFPIISASINFFDVSSNTVQYTNFATVTQNTSTIALKLGPLPEFPI